MAWMEQGWIKGVRRGPDALTWNISEDALRKFLREHPEEIRWKYMSSWSRLWIKDLLPKNMKGQAS